MKQLKNYFRLLFVFAAIFLCSKTNAQVNGFTISDGAFPTAHQLGTSFPVNVAFNWTPSTTSASAVIAYNNALIQYDPVCQNSLPGCMSVTNNGSSITIAISNLNSCTNTGSISFNVCFRFRCPDSCVGVNRLAVFNGTLTDNFNTIQTSTANANGILPNNVTLSNIFSSFNQQTAEVTYRVCYNNGSCFRIRNPSFNVSLSPSSLGTITSAYGSNYTYTVSGNTITPGTTVLNQYNGDCFYFVVKLPCNTGLGQTLTANVTMNGVNCNIPNSVIQGPVAASYTIPASPSSTSGISVGMGSSSSSFIYQVSNTGNSPLNLIITDVMPAVKLTSVSQSSPQPGLNASVQYFDCGSAGTAIFPLTGNATNSSVPSNTLKFDHTVNNLLPGQSVTLVINYSTASSCNGPAGTPPFRDSLHIVYNCAAPPNPCVPCGQGGVQNPVIVYNPQPAINCQSTNNIPGCKNIGDTVNLCYQFNNSGDAALAGGLLEVALPAGIQAVPGSVVYTGFSTAPAIVSATNINFSLPNIPTGSSNSYSICLKAVVQQGAVGGLNQFYAWISGTGYPRRALCYSAFNVCAYAAIGIEKKVKGSNNSTFGMSGQGAPNTLVDYQVTLRNTGTVPVDHLVMIDRIPAPGNLTILGSPSSATVFSQFGMLMQPAPASPDYTVNYTATQNICTLWPGTGTPCNSGSWGTAVANGGVRFTFTPTFSLPAGGSYTFAFQTKIPAGTANNSVDCNTAGFIATPTGGGTLNPTESAPVCVTSINPCNTNVTPNFNVSYSCVNYVYSVTGTSLETSTTNHEWSLMQTTQCGVTTDAVTGNGGNPVAPVQTTPNATFTITNFSICYYIKHRIYVPGCYDTTIRIPITVPHLTNSFILTDSDGNKKDSFCLGQDIYLDGSASDGENQYTIRILRRLAGTTNPYATWVTLPAFTGTAGQINLSQVLASQAPPYYFSSLYDYYVIFTVANTTQCIRPISLRKPFKVVCCDDFINSHFQLAVMPAAGSYTITAVLFNPYTNINATHEWYVLSSPNPGAGPYTPEYATTGTSFSWSGCQYGLYYTVIHKVKTSCGEICTAVEQYQSQGKNSVKESEECCLAFQFWPNGPGNGTQPVAAEFEFGTTPAGSGHYVITATPTYSYSNPNITHQWYVISSPTLTGPYTAAAYGTGNTFSFTATDGLYYFITHKLITPCGEVCFRQNIIRNIRDEKCDLCEPLGCKPTQEHWPKCYPPMDLKNDCRRGMLSWAPVPDAAGYEVQLNYNDEHCCRSEYEFMEDHITTDVTYVYIRDIRHPKFTCIRWRVRAKCEEGYSEWSEWLCYSCSDIIIGGPVIIEPKSLKASAGNSEGKDPDAVPQVAPNPNNGDMFLQMKVKGELTVAVSVYNSQGVLIKTLAEKKCPDGHYMEKLNLGAGIPKGMYMVVFKTNAGTFNQKVVVN